MNNQNNGNQNGNGSNGQKKAKSDFVVACGTVKLAIKGRLARTEHAVCVPAVRRWEEPHVEHYLAVEGGYNFRRFSYPVGLGSVRLSRPSLSHVMGPGIGMQILRGPWKNDCGRHAAATRHQAIGLNPLAVARSMISSSVKTSRP